MTELAYGKINLILDIIGKRMDQYHELKSLMIPIDFYDVLTFEACDRIQLTTNVDIPNNSVKHVIENIKNHYNVTKGVHVTLEKNIPIGAGLAGGSADITACIRGLDQFWGLNLSSLEKENLANQFGSDTLFTLYNKPAIITGRGDQITFVEMPEKIEDILLIVPNISLLTKDIFSYFKKDSIKDFDDAFQSVLNKDYSKLYNDLLIPALDSNKAYNDLYHKLKESGLNIHLSGSGSTFYIINPSERDIQILNTFKELKIIRTKQR